MFWFFELRGSKEDSFSLNKKWIQRCPIEVKSETFEHRSSLSISNSHMLISPKTRWPKTRLIEYSLTPNYCRMHKFGPTICACGPRIIAGMHISQICINKAPFGNNMVRSLLRALLKSLQKSLQTNDMNIGGPRGPCSYRSYLHRYRIFDHAIGRSVQLLAGNNWVSFVR